MNAVKSNESKRSGPVWQDDSAAIPREHSLKVAWAIAIVLALVVITASVIFKPDPFAEIITFIGDGLVVTFQITIVSMTFALVLGLVAGLGRTSERSWLNILSSLYVEIIRGIPLLAQLFWIYYALSRFIRLGPNVSAVLGLTICYGAYIGETFRGGIQSIPKGQMEAARALGLSRAQAMRYVIIPQAIRVILPPVGNEFIAMLKDSSLVSVLAISDMLRRGREYASRTFAYFETYTLVALVYLVVTLIFSRVVFYIEQGMSRENKEEPVTLMHRIAGFVVDLVVLDFIALPLYGVFQAVNANTDQIAMWIVITGIGFAVSIAVAYVLFFWLRTGRTPGMTAVGLRVVNAEGNIPTPKQAVIRFVVSLLPVPGLSILGAIHAFGGQPFQDRLSGTMIIRD
jgi:polar amino acid transport system permease protein